MLKLWASQRARSNHTAMSLAGHAVAVLCLPQTPPHSDSRQTTDRLGCGDALSCYICSQSGTKALQVSHQPCPQDLFCFQFLLAWEQTLSQQSKSTQTFSLCHREKEPRSLHADIPPCKCATKMTISSWDK